MNGQEFITLVILQLIVLILHFYAIIKKMETSLELTQWFWAIITKYRNDGWYEKPGAKT